MTITVNGFKSMSIEGETEEEKELAAALQESLRTGGLEPLWAYYDKYPNENAFRETED